MEIEAEEAGFWTIDHLFTITQIVEKISLQSGNAYTIPWLKESIR